MTSLYNRATPSQARILRIIEGAVKNAGDAHPEINISPQYRRSIAKRAAGTLSAQWPEVLAARSELSDSGASANFATAHRRRSERSLGVGRGGRNRLTASPLGRLHKRLVKEMWRITREEHPEYRRAMIDVLRMMAEAQAPTHKGG